MSNIEAFLAENAEKMEVEFFVVSRRFKDPKTKEPMKWQLKPLTEREVEEIRKKSRSKTKSKYGQFSVETDTDAVSIKMAVQSVIFPNLKDEALQKSYGVIGEENLLKNMLKSGECNDLITRVQEISGYDQDMDELVDEAKN